MAGISVCPAASKLIQYKQYRIFPVCTSTYLPRTEQLKT